MIQKIYHNLKEYIRELFSKAILLDMATEKIEYKWRFLTLTYRNDPHNIHITGTLVDQWHSTRNNVLSFLTDYCKNYYCSPEYTDNGRIHWHIMYMAKHGSRLKRLNWLKTFNMTQGYIKDVPVKIYIKCLEYIQKDREEMAKYFTFNPWFDKPEE